MEFRFHLDGSSRSVRLDEGEHVIGRSPDAAVCVPYPEIARTGAPIPPTGPARRKGGGRFDVTRLTLGSYSPGEGFNEVARTKIVEMLSSLFELIAAEESSGSLGTTACEFVSCWVTDERTSVLLADVQSPQVGPSKSMVAQHICSAMAVPLLDNQRMRGILHVDSTRKGTPAALAIPTARRGPEPEPVNCNL